MWVSNLAEDEGQYSHHKVWVVAGVLDGMTVDAQGKLWVAIALGGAIVQIDPETQTELLRIQLPVLGTTSLVFGGNEICLLVSKFEHDSPRNF